MLGAYSRKRVWGFRSGCSIWTCLGRDGLGRNSNTHGPIPNQNAHTHTLYPKLNLNQFSHSNSHSVIVAMASALDDAIQAAEAARNHAGEFHRVWEVLQTEAIEGVEAYVNAANDVILAVTALGNANVEVERLRAEASATALTELQNAEQEAKRIKELNMGLYPCFEAVFAILLYFVVATLYCFYRTQNYENMKHPNNTGYKVLAAFYFVVVTTFTIGYGDIHPITTSTKVDTVFLVFAAFLTMYLIDIVVKNVKSWIKNKCKCLTVAWHKDLILCGCSFLALVCCIGIGMLGILFTECRKKDGSKTTVLDSFYFSVLTLATVGYGDFFFQSKGGKVFAVCWIMICHPIYAHAYRHLMGSLVRGWRYFQVKLVNCWKNNVDLVQLLSNLLQWASTGLQWVASSLVLWMFLYISKSHFIGC